MPRPAPLIAALAACAAACLAWWPAPAAADDDADLQPLRVVAVGAQALPTAPLRLDLEGLPDAECTPALERVERSDRGIVVRLQQRFGCDASAAQASLRIDPPGNLGWGNAGVQRVRVEDDGGPAGSARLRGFSLIQVGVPARTIHPEPGYWWHERGGEFKAGGPGLGLNLERQGDTLSVTVLGYAADGRPEWLFGAGSIHGQVAQVRLSRLEDGSGPFDPYAAPGSAQPAGVLDLEVLSASRAVAWFQRNAPGGGISLVPMSIVRFRFDQQQAHALRGEWLLAGGSGQGSDGDRPLALRFVDIEAAGTGYRLLTAEGEHALLCELHPARPNSPPLRCTLLAADGSRLAEFADTALARMHGVRPDGTAVTLLRRPLD